MWKIYLTVFILSFGPDLVALPDDFDKKLSEYGQDTLKENQILYNGRIWRNLYPRIQEDQFLFSRDFIQGTLTIGGKTFSDLQLKYDIYKDELLTPVEDGIIQLNKEMIDSFRLAFHEREYKFIKINEDSVNTKSFFNVLYEGKSALYVKHIKKIDKMAVEGKYDKFYQINRIFVLRGNNLFPIKGKRELMSFVEDKKSEVMQYLKINKLRVTEKVPESFIPVLRYYDNLLN